MRKRCQLINVDVDVDEMTGISDYEHTGTFFLSGIPRRETGGYMRCFTD